MNKTEQLTDLKALEAVLGYSFENRELLEQALTHPSLNTENHYQRLEFLGDRVLGLIVANWLFEEFKDDKEGELSRRFIGIVRKETLSDVAQSLGLVNYISVKMAKDQTVGANNAIQADVIEAIIAAIYKDGGLDEATAFIKRHFASFLENITDTRDPKSALQEYAQGMGLPLPEYTVENREGPDHNPVFTIKVVVKNTGNSIATGNSKREAEVKAASDLLIKLGEGE